jgi:hypothetical protein
MHHIHQSLQPADRLRMKKFLRNSSVADEPLLSTKANADTI